MQGSHVLLTALWMTTLRASTCRPTTWLCHQGQVLVKGLQHPLDWLAKAAQPCAPVWPRIYALCLTPCPHPTISGLV